MPRRLTLVLSAVALLAGAGGAAGTNIPRLDFAYDAKAPLAYADHGLARGTQGRVHDVSFRSQGRTVQGYLVLPAGAGRHAAVVVVHGSGGDRRELLDRAKALAARGIVALTITEPSSSSPPGRRRRPIR
jgi:hypothetical protein